MMLFPTLTTAIRRDFAGMIFRYGPAAVALVYPLALAALHLSGQHFVRATATTNRLQAGFAIFLAAALICAVPLISFTVISRSDRPRERYLAHLAFAALDHRCDFSGLAPRKSCSSRLESRYEQTGDGIAAGVVPRRSRAASVDRPARVAVGNRIASAVGQGCP